MTKVNKDAFDAALGKMLRAPAVPLSQISPKKARKAKAKKRAR
jgi:hypothetical protein